jgi:hypothetical protein
VIAYRAPVIRETRLQPLPPPRTPRVDSPQLRAEVRGLFRAQVDLVVLVT